MPLSASVERELVHTRTIESWGYRRSDGLWDVEAHLRDQKTYDQKNDWRGEILAGEPVHDMWVRLTLDDDLIVRDIETSSDQTPFALCGEVAPIFVDLKGEAIGPGWSRTVRKKVGGVRGCTHLVELLGRVANTAFQMIFPLRGTFPSRGNKQPLVLNTCHGWSEKSPVVKKRFPEWYTGE
jgi:hypothetical protein